MRYNTIIENDVVNGQGICVSFWVQGCPHRCPGCFNPETWNFDGGTVYTSQTREKVIEALKANGVQRNLSILGGEPFAERNLPMVADLIAGVKRAYPEIQIFIWTGFYFYQLEENNEYIKYILNNTTFLIDGPFIQERKNLDLPLRGSDNQFIWYHIRPGEWEEVSSRWKTLR